MQAKLDRSRVSGVHHAAVPIMVHPAPCNYVHVREFARQGHCPEWHPIFVQGGCTSAKLQKKKIRPRFVGHFFGSKVNGPLKSFQNLFGVKCFWRIWVGLVICWCGTSKKSAREVGKKSCDGGRSYRFWRFPWLWGILSNIHHPMLFGGTNCDTPISPFWVLLPVACLLFAMKSPKSCTQSLLANIPIFCCKTKDHRKLTMILRTKAGQ